MKTELTTSPALARADGPIAGECYDFASAAVAVVGAGDGGRLRSDGAIRIARLAPTAAA